MPSVIVLGVRPDSRDALNEMEKRVKRGLEVAEELNADFIIFSGGRTAGNYSEAFMMQRIAEQEGSRFNSILETRSLDTLGNAYFTARIVSKLSDREVVIVSGPAHIERAKRLFSFVFARDMKAYCHGTAEEGMNEKEREAYEFATAMLEGIKPGDLEGIWERMSSMHPLYSVTR
jgi:vancomycin permeability regulator SanA